MRNSLFVLVALILLGSCNQNTDGFTISGSLRGEVENGTNIFLKKIGDDNQPIEVDTVLVADGKFKFTGTAVAPELHYIFVDKLKGYSAIILESGEIEFSAQKDSLGFAKVEGTFQNETFSDFMEASRELTLQAQDIQQDMQAARGSADKQASVQALKDEMLELQEEYKTFEIDFIKTNGNALISALVLERIISGKAIEAAEIQELYDGFTPDIKNTKPGKRILEAIENLKKAEEAKKNTEIGEKAPDFSGPNPEGKTIALNDVKGKITLVDFWAAWCKPCRQENPNVVAVYNKYHEKGLNVVGVSLDRTEEAWKKAISEDGLEWNHVYNTQENKIAIQYNVEAIPAAFLLDENGVIVAKNLRGPALEEKVAELLN